MYSSATIIPGQPHAAISGASGPNSQTIVFINELGSDPAQWQLLAPALEDRYQIVQLTLPGPTTPDPPASRGAARWDSGVAANGFRFDGPPGPKGVGAPIGRTVTTAGKARLEALRKLSERPSASP